MFNLKEIKTIKSQINQNDEVLKKILKEAIAMAKKK